MFGRWLLALIIQIITYGEPEVKYLKVLMLELLGRHQIMELPEMLSGYYIIQQIQLLSFLVLQAEGFIDRLMQVILGLKFHPQDHQFTI
jgi:hypothetical protein